MHARDGLFLTIRTQRNARIHVTVGVLVITLAILLGFGRLEFCVLFLTIGAVLAAETINTTVEAIVDLLSPEFHESAKIAKDVSAGAVLIISISAVLIGLFIFGPPLWDRIMGFTQSHEWNIRK